ncbi:MurR/RpiR family transcriptional regulator [Thermophilibacter sp.]
MGVLIKLRDCESLSPAEAQVRDAIIADPRGALSSTVYELAEAAYTSPSTVSRLCKRVGISSYANLRLMLAEEVNHLETIDLAYLDTTTIEPEDTPAQVVEKLTNISIKTIQETHELVDLDALAQAVDLIRAASILDFYGVGASLLVALDAESKFTRVGKCSIVHQHYDRQKVQAINSDASHVGLIFSYSGESPEMRVIARILKDNATPTISFTKSDRNSVSRLATCRLFVTARESLQRAGAMASRTAQLYMVDLLYTLFITSDYDRSVRQISRTALG